MAGTTNSARSSGNAFYFIVGAPAVLSLGGHTGTRGPARLDIGIEAPKSL